MRSTRKQTHRLPLTNVTEPLWLLATLQTEKTKSQLQPHYVNSRSDNKYCPSMLFKIGGY